MRFIKVVAVILISVFTMCAFADPDIKDASYSIVIYQGNCTSHAAMYEVDAEKQVKIVALASVNSISNEKILGKNCNLKFNDGSVSMVELCLQNLKNDYNNNDDIANKDEIIKIDTIVVGIAGYNDFKDVIYDKEITKLTHFTDSLIQSIQSNNFHCDNEHIKIMHDIDLINISSIKLIEDDIIEKGLKEKNAGCENIWTFFLSSLAVGIKASKKSNQFMLDRFLYLENIGGGYYNLGKESASLFISVADQQSPATSEVQKSISESDIGKDIINNRGQTFSYWLKENPDNPTCRNNARGLAVVEYALSKNLLLDDEKTNILVKPIVKKIVEVETDKPDIEVIEKEIAKLNLEDKKDNEMYADASIDNLKGYTLDLIDESIDMLVESIEGIETEHSDDSVKSEPVSVSVPNNEIILVTGDLLSCDFIKTNYEEMLDERIINPEVRSRIKLVNMKDFILGLVLASESFK